MELNIQLNVLKTHAFVVVSSPKHHKVVILSKMKPHGRIRKRKKSLNQNMKSTQRKSHHGLKYMFISPLCDMRVLLNRDVLHWFPKWKSSTFSLITHLVLKKRASIHFLHIFLLPVKKVSWQALNKHWGLEAKLLRLKCNSLYTMVLIFFSHIFFTCFFFT